MFFHIHHNAEAKQSNLSEKSRQRLRPGSRGMVRALCEGIGGTLMFISHL